MLDARSRRRVFRSRILSAMREELDRSKSQHEDGQRRGALLHRVPPLGCGGIYRRSRVRRACAQNQRVARARHSRGGASRRLQAGQLLRARTGVVDLAPLGQRPHRAAPPIVASRRIEAYKAASQALASKEGRCCSQYSSGAAVRRFREGPACAVDRAAARNSNFCPKPWKQMLEKSTDAFPHGPENPIAYRLSFKLPRGESIFCEHGRNGHSQGYTSYYFSFSGATQAEDGMRLGRSPYYITASA